MKFLALAFGLAATVTAIDLRLYSFDNCEGGFLYCGGANPDFCCRSPGNAFVSVESAAIPTEWNTQLRAYENGDCNTLRGLLNSGGRNSLCFQENTRIARLTGVGWNFVNQRKREVNAECRDADRFTTGDGATFDLSGLEKPLLEGLLAHWTNGTQAADIEAVYDAYKIEA